MIYYKYSKERKVELMNINATAMRRIANKKLEEKRERIFDNAIAFIEHNIIEEATKDRFFYKFANPKELKIDNDEVVFQKIIIHLEYQGFKVDSDNGLLTIFW